MDKADVGNVIRQNIEKELEGISVKGLTAGNLDIAYKLVEMYYRIILISRIDNDNDCDCDFDYQNAKRHYRSDKCEGSKQEVIECLKKKVSLLDTEIKDLWNDADFEEERIIIERLKGGF